MLASYLLLLVSHSDLNHVTVLAARVLKPKIPNF
jgi:hypothetical protein